MSTSFEEFYVHHFLAEHRHPANVALHIFGTVASAAFLPAMVLSAQPWWALLYPLVHAAPGVLGHRLFERDAAVGDMRLMRTDFPLWWFIIGNHRMTWEKSRRWLGLTA